MGETVSEVAGWVVASIGIAFVLVGALLLGHAAEGGRRWSGLAGLFAWALAGGFCYAGVVILDSAR